ncbi:MAG TPA: energy transducer TonB [Gemmatimonadaceae bacterium]|nr:energy transducer TonB [Gemmatimonadaceae bacterium]
MTLPAVLLAMVSLAACATGGGGGRSRAALLLSDAPPPRPDCHVEPGPSPLPPISAIADSAGLFYGLTRLGNETGAVRQDTAYLLLSVRYDRDRRVSTVFRISSYLPEGAEAKVLGEVRRHLGAGPANTESLRLRIAFTRPMMVRVGRSERCPPPIGARIGSTRNSAGDGDVHIVPPKFHVVVLDNGQLGAVTVLRGSGDDEFDRALIDALRQSARSPGTIDGKPATMEFDMSVPVAGH